MEKPCPKCGMMFGSHASGCPDAKNPFAVVERLVAPKPGEETARSRQVGKARNVLRLAEDLRRENAAKGHRLGSNPELEIMTPLKRWEAVRQVLDRKIERLAGNIQDAKVAAERRRLMVRFKGMTSFKGKVDDALAGEITAEIDSALMHDPDSVYVLDGGDAVTGIDRDLMLEENESLRQATGKLADALAEFDVAQGRVEQEEQALAIKPEEQDELDKGLDARLKKAYKFITRERLAEAEVTKIDTWLDGDPEADADSLDKIPLSEALRRLSFFRDEMWRIEHLPEKTEDEREIKDLERKRLVVWRDALLKRVGTPKLEMRLWDVAEHAEKLEKDDILHFDDAEKRRMDVLWVARRIADNGLSEKILEKLFDAKGKIELSDSEARILLTAALTHDFTADHDFFGESFEEEKRKWLDTEWEYVRKDFDKRGETTRKKMAEAIRFRGISGEMSDLLWKALMKHADKSWAKGALDLISMRAYGLGESQKNINSAALRRLDKRLMGLAYARYTEKFKKIPQGASWRNAGWRLSWERTNLAVEDEKVLETFLDGLR